MEEKEAMEIYSIAFFIVIGLAQIIDRDYIIDNKESIFISLTDSDTGESDIS